MQAPPHRSILVSLCALSLFLIPGQAFALASRDKTCVVSSKYASSNGTADDSQAIFAAFTDCARDAVITFSEGVHYNVFQPIVANLSNVAIEVQGNLHLPQNISYVSSIVNGNVTLPSVGTFTHWFKFSGPSLDWIGTSNVTNGWINSHGQAWWDANPTNGSGLTGRPHLMSFSTTDGTMQHFKSKNPIAWNVALTGTNITVTDTIIDTFSTTGSFPFNTDGFDIQGNNIRVLNSVIFNGDDAIAIQAGTHNVLIQGGTIGYQSHGLSIGSLGKDPSSFANVTDIMFDDITVINAVYGARMKSWIGGVGLAKNITWSNVRTYNVTFPIFVTQTYFDQNSAGAADRPTNSSVQMQDFTWSNFTGTINTYQPGDGSCITDPCWYNIGLPNLKHTEAIIIECNTNSSCQNFVSENIQLMPQNGEDPTTVCINAMASLNPGLGFSCANETYVPM